MAGVMTLIGYLINSRLQSKFQKYSQVALSNGMTGKQVAESMLKYYGIYDVTIQSVEGSLTDHYDPSNKTVNLSESVYNCKSVSAAAVAAHECGHAVQHAEGYAALRLRSAIVPMVKVASGMQQFLFMAGMLLIRSAFGKPILLFTILVFAVTTLFSLITLPVEFDASRRALVWLESSGTTRTDEQAGAKDALWWAAMTYVAAALSSLVTLLYLVLQYNRRN